MYAKVYEENYRWDLISIIQNVWRWSISTFTILTPYREIEASSQISPITEMNQYIPWYIQSISSIFSSYPCLFIEDPSILTALMDMIIDVYLYESLQIRLPSNTIYFIKNPNHLYLLFTCKKHVSFIVIRNIIHIISLFLMMDSLFLYISEVTPIPLCLWALANT